VSLLIVDRQELATLRKRDDSNVTAVTHTKRI